MRDLITRGGFVSPIHRAAVMAAHDDLRAGPAEPAGGDFGVGRSSVHAGAGTAAGRAPEATQPNGEAMRKIHSLWMRPLSDAEAAELTAALGRDPGHITLLPHNTWSDVMDEIEAIYAAAQRAMAEAGPMPLAGSKPWVERDAEYRERLRGILRRMLWTWDELDGDDLTNIGEEVGLPRARLVLVTLNQEDAP